MVIGWRGRLGAAVPSRVAEADSTDRGDALGPSTVGSTVRAKTNSFKHATLTNVRVRISLQSSDNQTIYRVFFPFPRLISSSVGSNNKKAEHISGLPNLYTFMKAANYTSVKEKEHNYTGAYLKVPVFLLTVTHPVVPSPWRVGPLESVGGV